ncbi:hypothetical protein LguiB_000464 [Lonicera macranthoides]
MDRYQKVERPRPELPINENEIRITSQGLVRNYINYALSLLQERRGKEIVLKAMGQAISKTVAIAEIIKRRVPRLHQDTAISSVSITDVWEPIEEGLFPVEMTRQVSMISITLSPKELNKNSPGYQPPASAEQNQPTRPQYNHQQRQQPRQTQYNYQQQQQPRQAQYNYQQQQQQQPRQPQYSYQQPRDSRAIYNAGDEDTYGYGRGRGRVQGQSRGRGRGGGRNYSRGAYGNYQENGGYSNWGQGGGRGGNWGYRGTGYGGGRGSRGGGGRGGYGYGRGGRGRMGGGSRPVEVGN